MGKSLTEVWVKKSDLTATKIMEQDCPVLETGEVLVAVDKFALTSNNVSYALSGDLIGYWNFFPTGKDRWGKVTVWGMADVIESTCPDIAVGERIYGFFPMASHVVLKPGRVKAGHFLDVADHRQTLPSLYNQYMRTQAEPEAFKTLENERCLYFPLFITGYVIADLLADNDWFGAEQIIVGSASSKTGIGTLAFLKEQGFAGELVGLTSSNNMGFVDALGLADKVVAYGDVKTLSNKPTVYVDMSGDAGVRSDLHHHFGANMVTSLMVGLTHWDSQEHDKTGLPGAKPSFFFAPAQIEKRNTDWGPGVLMERGYMASAQLAARLKEHLSVEHHSGAQAVRILWADMLANRVSGQRGLMMRL